jgi:hypothetical protein
MDSYYLDAAIGQKGVFAFIEQLMNGHPIEPSEKEALCLLKVAQLLGNTELLNKLIDTEAPLQLSNARARLESKSLAGQNMEAEIEFTAEHFHELDLKAFSKLDISIIERIISSPALRLDNEDSLLRFVLSVTDDPQTLLRYLWCEYLSSEGMATLLDALSPSTLDSFTWASLCRRLLLPVLRTRSSESPGAGARFLKLPATSSERREGGIQCPLPVDKSLDGVIAYLTRKHRGNVHDLGIVTVTSKSLSLCNSGRANVVNFAGSSCFWSAGGRGQWICWDFHESRIFPTNYTIRSNQLKGWLIEGSVDGESWKEIDRKTETTEFSAHSLVAASFEVAHPAECRFIRMTQLSRHDTHDRLFLHDVEFFGTFFESEQAAPGTAQKDTVDTDGVRPRTTLMSMLAELDFLD